MLNPLNLFGSIVGGMGGKKAAQFDREQVEEMNRLNNSTTTICTLR